MTNEQTPQEIDTILARIWREQQIVAGRRNSAERTIADADRYGLLPYQIEAAEARLVDAEADLAKLDAEAAPYEAEYAARRWNRYFLVQNSNGHVHRGMDCSTCFASTEYAWLPELSGCDEAEMVDEFGEKACTVCFPDAPALPSFAGPGRRDREAVEARQAEKASKAAEKAAKAITAPDGSPLRVGYDTLRTKVSAQRALSERVQSFGWFGPSHPSDFVGQIRSLVEALEAAGIETAPIIERASKKVAKEGGQFEIREAIR